MKRKLTKADMLLVMLSAAMLIGYYTLENNKRNVPDEWYRDKLNASALMLQAMDGVGQGDRVAVNFSGSFPALNLAVMSAVQVLELEPVIIASAGASTWGANQPEFTYIDMEELLYRKGLFLWRSAAVSVGRSDDIGKDMDTDVVRAMVERFEKQGRKVLMDEDFERNIDTRTAIYLSGNKRIKCFVNVGGNLAATGGDEKKGLIGVFQEKNIPVINLINIKKLAADYGLPIDPYPIPEVGEGGVYYDETYPRGSVAVLLAAFKLVILNSIRALPHYLGAFIIAESITVSVGGKPFNWLRGLVAILIIPLVYKLIYFIYGFNYDFGMPAFIALLSIILIENLNYSNISIAKKSVIFVLLLLGVQWMDVIPELSHFGFGRGEVSADVKLIAEFIGASEVLTFAGATFIVIFTLNAFLRRGNKYERACESTGD